MRLDNCSWLEDWYQKQCNGGWEHQYGVRIETIDNPAWMVKIDLNGTRYAEIANVEIKENYESESEWMICKIVDAVYEGVGGPRMLGPIIQEFRGWIEAF
jgi:hypothetical protein